MQAKGSLTQADSGYPRFQLLSQEQRHQIAGAALGILERIGMKTTQPDIVETLRQAGAQVDGNRVKLPAVLVEEAMHSAPNCITIYNQQGEEALYLSGYNTYFGASVDGPTILDPRTGGYRECLEEDIAWIVRLADDLLNISFLMPAGFAADRDVRLAERISFKQCILNSSKPILDICQSMRDLEDIYEMAALVAGGKEELQQRPFLIHYAEPISPLVNPDASLQRVRYCAKHQIPLLYSPFLAMGATAPQHMAAAVAQGCAESLFGLVVHQVSQRGAPFIMGAMPSLMDMKTTSFAYGAPELQLMCASVAEMAHHFKIPSFGTAGTGDAKRFDGQAVLEATSSCYLAILSGSNLIHDVGLFGGAQLLIPEMIVAVDEIISMIRRSVEGFAINEETLALDLMQEVGPGGEYVSHPDTLKHFRDAWYPSLLDRGAFDPSLCYDTFEERVNRKTLAAMEAYGPAAVPFELTEQLREMDRHWTLE
jgi:trimethylamine--corrinoid protein Co-methyltransferase